MRDFALSVEISSIRSNLNSPRCGYKVVGRVSNAFQKLERSLVRVRKMLSENVTSENVDRSI